MARKSRRRVAPGLQYARTAIRIDNFSRNSRVLSPGAPYWSKLNGWNSHDNVGIGVPAAPAAAARAFERSLRFVHAPRPFETLRSLARLDTNERVGTWCPLLPRSGFRKAAARVLIRFTPGSAARALPKQRYGVDKNDLWKKTGFCVLSGKNVEIVTRGSLRVHVI
jgi:hypothetical protein